MLTQAELIAEEATRIIPLENITITMDIQPMTTMTWMEMGI